MGYYQPIFIKLMKTFLLQNFINMPSKLKHDNLSSNVLNMGKMVADVWARPQTR